MSPLCTTHLSGIDWLKNPIGSPCSYVPSSVSLSQAVVPNTAWHYSAELTGISPFVSSTQGEWFDPRAVAHQDEHLFLTPNN